MTVFTLTVNLPPSLALPTQLLHSRRCLPGTGYQPSSDSSGLPLITCPKIPPKPKESYLLSPLPSLSPPPFALSRYLLPDPPSLPTHSPPHPPTPPSSSTLSTPPLSPTLTHSQQIYPSPIAAQATLIPLKTRPPLPCCGSLFLPAYIPSFRPGSQERSSGPD